VISLELYVIEDAEDALIAGREGIYDFIIDGSECHNCSMVLGPIEDIFLACVVITSPSQQAWPLCIECAYPLLFPTETVLFFSTEDIEEEFDEDFDF
jgi:hypothetical protein